MFFDQEKAIKEIEKISFNIESFTLPNGLRVVLNHNTRIPTIAVAVMYHAGAAREKEGKTGLAHLFEHMMFQKSEHVKEGVFFRTITESGGALNGGTWQDGTMYYEIVPKNFLEKVLWLESDRMGYLLDAITPESLSKEIDVVMNEKRQRYDNYPYGYTTMMTTRSVFDNTHPYHIDTIGEMKDLASITISDLKKFFKQWYGPNNAVLVISGDMRGISVQKLVEKYFNDIPRGETVDFPEKNIPVFDSIKKIIYRDQRAPVPFLKICFPTAEMFHEDYYPMYMFGDIIGNSKSSPLYKKLIEEKQCSSSVFANYDADEIAGVFSIYTKLRHNKQVSDVYDNIKLIINDFTYDTQSSVNLQKKKAGIERDFYLLCENNLDIIRNIALVTAFKNDPYFFKKEIISLLSVSDNDVKNVFEKYVREANHACIQILPSENIYSPLLGSDVFVPEKEDGVLKIKNKEIIEKEGAFSSFDRSEQPEKEEDPIPLLPQISTTGSKDLKIAYVLNKHIPMNSAQIRIPLMILSETKENNGITNILSRMLKDGTREKSATQFEDELLLRGIYLDLDAKEGSLLMHTNMPSRTISDGVSLIKEMLEKPLLSDASFDKYIAKSRAYLDSLYSSNDSIADHVLDIALYEEGSPSTFLRTGTHDSLSFLTSEYVRNYYSSNMTAHGTSIAVAGEDAERLANEIREAFVSLGGRAPVIPEIKFGKNRGGVLYLVDMPGSTQSEIRFGCQSPKITDPDFFPLVVSNYILGGSIFNNRLTKIIREEKGYTYGIHSSVNAGLYDGVFSILTSVNTHATADSVNIIKNIVSQYSETFTEEEHKTTIDSIYLSYIRKYETNDECAQVADNIAYFNLPSDYIKNRMDFLKNCKTQDIKNVFSKWIYQDDLVCVVVGDKKKIIKDLEKLDFKKIIEYDKFGNKLE